MAQENLAPGEEILGNTKRISASVRWCFTLNNYTEDHIAVILEKFCGSIKYFIFQEEKAPGTGTPHLQGFVRFATKKRAGEFIGIKEIHWEKCKGSDKQNIKYCSKHNGGLRRWVEGIKVPTPVKIINKLFPWQLAVEAIVAGPIDDRAIHWFWEPIGNVGKSALVKYLCVKYNCLVVSGKSTDIKYLCVKYFETHGDYPTTILMDVPRESYDYISWTGLEEVKNGCFASTKYECQMVIMNSPRLICFANKPPPAAVVSQDRWRTQKITMPE